MLTKRLKEQQIINIGRDLIVINKVTNEQSLYRVLINAKFSGFIQERDGEFHRLDGHDIHNLLFARLSTMMK